MWVLESKDAEEKDYQVISTRGSWHRQLVSGIVFTCCSWCCYTSLWHMVGSINTQRIFEKKKSFELTAYLVYKITSGCISPRVFHLETLESCRGRSIWNMKLFFLSFIPKIENYTERFGLCFTVAHFSLGSGEKKIVCYDYHVYQTFFFG